MQLQFLWVLVQHPLVDRTEPFGLFSSGFGPRVDDYYYYKPGNCNCIFSMTIHWLLPRTTSHEVWAVTHCRHCHSLVALNEKEADSLWIISWFTLESLCTYHMSFGLCFNVCLVIFLNTTAPTWETDQLTDNSCKKGSLYSTSPPLILELSIQCNSWLNAPF